MIGRYENAQEISTSEKLNKISKFWPQFWINFRKTFQIRNPKKFTAWKMFCAPIELEIVQSVQFFCKNQKLKFFSFWTCFFVCFWVLYVFEDEFSSLFENITFDGFGRLRSSVKSFNVRLPNKQICCWNSLQQLP